MCRYNNYHIISIVHSRAYYQINALTLNKKSTQTSAFSF
nr:MAG TPA: hypothetical protein [Caudoviricetes sp.]